MKAIQCVEGLSLSRCSHSVHFYEDGAVFLESMSEFMGAALGAGGACIVIATRKHRQGLEYNLRTLGIDVEFGVSKNRCIALTAEETLARFMIDRWPDETCFRTAIEPE